MSTSLWLQIHKCEECGLQYRTPDPCCLRCSPEQAKDFRQKARESALEAVPYDLDLYSDGLLVWLGQEYGFALVRNAGIFMRTKDHASREKLVQDAMSLRDENRALLVENATLRRSLERTRR